MNPSTQRLLIAVALTTVSLSGSGHAQAKAITDDRLAVQTITTPGGAVRARIRLGKMHTGSETGKTRIAVRVRDARDRPLGLLVAFSDQVSTEVRVRLSPSARRMLKARGRLRATVRAEVGGASVGTVGVTLTSRSGPRAGQRVTVTRAQLLLYRDPAKSYIGSLQRGQSFKVRRVSPSGRYAYGFAYGKYNKAAWVRTDQL